MSVRITRNERKPQPVEPIQEIRLTGPYSGCLTLWRQPGGWYASTHGPHADPRDPGEGFRSTLTMDDLRALRDALNTLLDEQVA